MSDADFSHQLTIKTYAGNTAQCLNDSGGAQMQMESVINKLRMCMPGHVFGFVWMDVQVSTPDPTWSDSVAANIQFLQELAFTWLTFGSLVSSFAFFSFFALL